MKNVNDQEKKDRESVGGEKNKKDNTWLKNGSN